MPLARIVTACVADAVPLARRLREQGYSVEIVSPGALVATPAEVEFTVERLAGAAALERAAEFSSAYDADVHVAPGTLAVERPLPKAPAAPAGEVPDAPHVLAAPPVSLPVPERQDGKSVLPPQRSEASATQADTHPFRDACQQARTALGDAWKSGADRFGAGSHDLRRRSAGLEQPLRDGWQRTVRALAASSRRAAAGLTNFAQRLRSWEKRAHAKAAPRAAALSAAAKQNVAATTKTELQRAGRLAASFGGLLRTVPAALVAVLQRGFATIPKPAPVRVYSARRREWHFALAGAAAASLLLTLGWAAYTNRRPAGELLPRAADRLLPAAEGATIEPSKAPVAPAAVALPAAPASARPLANPLFARPEGDQVAEDSVVYHGAPKSDADVEETSDDEVTVRHYPRRTREQAATPARSGVKKISDLDD